MSGLLAEVGKKLAERWLSLLVLPGALLLASLLAGQRLGHERWYDIGALPGRLDQAVGSLTGSTASLVVLLLAFLLTSAACGVVAQALGSFLERLWLAENWPSWPAPTHRFVRHRIARRRERYIRRREEVGQASAQQHLGPDGGTDLDTAAHRLAVARSRLRDVADALPERPTWTGDRLRGTEARLREELGIDVAVVWPHLWLQVADTTRSEVAAAREAMARAATLAGWGVLYVLVAVVWWPGVVVPAVVVTTGWRRFRAATDTYATLVEAAVRLHSRELAQHLGIGHNGPLTKRTGAALTGYLAEGTSPASGP
jgi:hypothetical protein